MCHICFPFKFDGDIISAVADEDRDIDPGSKPGGGVYRGCSWEILGGDGPLLEQISLTPANAASRPYGFLFCC